MKENETADHKEKHLLAKQMSNKKVKETETETAEHKEKRLLAKQMSNKKVKENETAEHKEKRLLAKQVYNKKIRGIKGGTCLNTNKAGKMECYFQKCHLSYLI